MKSLSSAFLFFFICSLASLGWAKEAMMLEGSMGQSNISIFSPQDTDINIKGVSSLIRFHIALADHDHQVFALTLSNQVYQGKVFLPSTDQTQSLSFSGLGVGLSYRFVNFIFGAEYQQASMSQLTVGTSPVDHHFSVMMPHYYGGLFHKFGTLGMALIYSQKDIRLGAEVTGLPGDRPYRENTAYFSITYHFWGTASYFFDSLFDPNYL